MKILIACEESGIVRDAFIARGHDAISCDLLPTRRPGPHICGDVRPLLVEDWDLIIAFPPCTYLNSAGMHWTTRGLRDPKLTEDALDFVRLFLDHKCPRIALENPVGAIGTRIRPASQWIQPYQFGHDASKKTGLWLKGLPFLKPTKLIPRRLVEWPKGSGKIVERWANQTDSGQNRLTPGPTRARDRSETYAGIAAAMAEQWGNL
jgi:hypothetical protein